VDGDGSRRKGRPSPTDERALAKELRDVLRAALHYLILAPPGRRPHVQPGYWKSRLFECIQVPARQSPRDHPRVEQA
jgi:hypothetical protein